MFQGAGFVDSAGAPVGTPVEAVIGSTVCAQAKTVPSPVDTGFGSIYTLVVPSASDVSGCGVEVALLTFRVNGRVANGSAPWHAVQQTDPSRLPFPAPAPEPVAFNLVVGPPIFTLAGYIKGANPPSGSSIKALVGTIECGSGEVLPPEPQGDAWYRIIVKSDVATKGCARAGSEIRLVVNGQAVAERILADVKTRQVDVTLPLRSPGLGDELPRRESSRDAILIGAALGVILVFGLAVLVFARRLKTTRP